ncbi:sorting nexin-21 isoform X2 [Micropterus salmoides]|uniref:sorting nexin-21 isoform X2 n=1 Tax=Micropterus salmoides TaxID=27706 RepID=UPI0018EA61EE|nr:sorting nexin-21 isoform X2 [Micropterus salmoides]
MATRLLDRLKRSLFKDGQGAGPEHEAGGGQEEEEFKEESWEAELEEEEECVTDRLGGTLCFDSAGGGAEDGAEGSGPDSDSDFLGESMEEGLSSTDTSPVGVSPVAPSPSSSSSSSLLTRQLQESWRSLRGLGGGSPAPAGRRLTDNLLFEVTDASVVQDSSSKYVGALCVRQFFYLTDLQTGQVLIRVGRYQDALGPLLNAKRLQHKLGWECYYDNQAQAPPPASSHWFFTLVGLSWCFQEVDQLEEARDHCDHALRVLTPAETQADTAEERPLPREDKPVSQPHVDRPHPLLMPLLRVVVRLSWQTGRDKRHWEELLHQLEERWVGLDNQPTIKEFLVKHNLEESEGEG